MVALNSRYEGLKKWLLPMLAVLLAIIIGIYACTKELALNDPSVTTGYILICVMFGLFALRFRKRLSMIPIGRVAVWLQIHIGAGILAILVFWIHTGTIWPTGFIEQLLTLLVYLVTLSGILGHLLQKVYSRRATETGHEIIYERIPSAVSELRGAAEATVLECGRVTGSDTIGRYYVESLEWFFKRPRFTVYRLAGSQIGSQWVNQHEATASRYLSDSERPYLEKLVDLMDAKNVIDHQYVAQRAMKIWRWFHVPTSAALIVLSLWHFILIQVYAL